VEQEGRIVDLDGEDGELGLWVPPPSGPRPGPVFAGLVIAAVAAALALGPLGLARGSSTTSPGPAAPTSLGGASGDSASPSALDVPGATPLPSDSSWSEPTPFFDVITAGWPVTVDYDHSRSLDVGPDGTVYLGDLPPLDATGHPRPNWLIEPDGTQAQPFAFGSDGTIYAGTQQLNTIDLVWIFGPDGYLRSSSPLEVDNFGSYAAGPDGSIHFVSPPLGDAANTIIAILQPDGSSSRIDTPGSVQQAVVDQEGTIYLGVWTGLQGAGGFSLRVLSPDGTQLAGDGPALWSGMAMAPNGTPYAWAYDMATGSDSQVVRSRIAAIGKDGRPEPGWPLTLPGGISAPSFGPDGTLYLLNGYSKVIALGPDGRVRPGWPVMLPEGDAAISATGGFHAPNIAQPPVVDDRGTVYVAGTSETDLAVVAAFDSVGRIQNGWPVKLDSSLASFAFGFVGGYDPDASPVFVRASSGLIRHYVALENQIVALGENGSPVPGWPITRPASSAGWRDMWAAPDGGLIVEVETWPMEGSPVEGISRLTASGQLVQ